MPTGVYKRTEKHFKQIREAFNKGREIAHSLPRNDNQRNSARITARENIKKSHKLPRTEKQRLHSKRIGTLPKTGKQIESCIENGKRNGRLNFKGEFTRNSNGYIMKYCPEHPNGPRVRYHILLVEEKLGRYLKTEEECHHVNEVRDDNRIQNLMCFSNKSAHQRWHGNPENVKPEEIVFDGRRLI